MSLANDFNAILDEYRQDAAAIEARKMFTNLYREIVHTNAQAQAIKDSGKFDLIPATVKVALGNWWDLYKVIQADIEADADLVESISIQL